MTVRASTHPHNHSNRCVICRAGFNPKQNRASALYCSNACSMKAYRRRKADERTNAAQRRRESDANKHRTIWVDFLISSGSLSRKQAERVYTALTSIDRLRGEPYERLTFD
jgi:hypothetical protein